jgi:hypothetical protein
MPPLPCASILLALVAYAAFDYSQFVPELEWEGITADLKSLVPC